MPTNTTMFEQASRQHLRFDSPKGLLSVDDLWDLPLTSGGTLDLIAKALHKQLENNDDISFVKPVVSSNSKIQLKFDIVKYVIETRIAERDANTLAAARAEQKQKILGILARKQDGKLEEMSAEDLQKMADSM